MKRPVWAIVPAKSPSRGKSRLRGALADEARAAFARELLVHVLGVLRASELDGVLVATDADEVEALARESGAEVLRDGAPGTLARVVDGALAEVSRRGARAALVLMADLPKLAVSDVRELLRALDDASVAAAPDHLGVHTNALALAPPDALATSFGRPDSFAAHEAAAREAGLTFARVDSAAIAFDVDEPADLALLRPPGGGSGSGRPA